MDRKLVAATVKALDTDNPNGEFLVTLSAPTLDRDGEIVDYGALDPLPDHISFDIDHGMSTATTVGSGKPFYDGDRLMVRGTFASTPLGQEVRTLVNEGHIRTTSVAMMRPEKEKRDDGVHITKAELLNGAFVPVPANTTAVVVASKAADAGQGTTVGGIRVERAADPVEFAEAVRDAMIKAGARNSAKDAESIHVIHDRAAALLGLDCVGGSKDVAPSREDVTGADGTKSTREDTTGAGGDDEKQHLELRARALRLLAET